MIISTNEFNTMLSSEEKERFDANFKAFLANKSILAVIIKSNCAEYKELSETEIMDLIEGEPYVAAFLVDPGLSAKASEGGHISGMNTESSIVGEGLVRFDIVTYILSPERTRHNAVVLNIEAQNATGGTQYPYGERAVYYCARLISSQKDNATVGFTGTDYQNLHKVYSIWIVTAGKRSKRSSLSRLALAPKGDETFLREFQVNYDLMEILFMYVGDNWAEWYNQNQSLSMLGLYLDNGKKVQDKCKELEERFHIPMSNELVENVEDQTRMYWYYMERALSEYEEGHLEKIAEMHRLDLANIEKKKEGERLDVANDKKLKEGNRLDEINDEKQKEGKRLDEMNEKKRQEAHRIETYLETLRKEMSHLQEKTEKLRSDLNRQKKL